MEVIISHANLDFDGLAAMVAAQRLYPRAKLGLSGRMNENVRQFVSLHKDSLALEHAAGFDTMAINRLIVVDTKVPQRLGKFQACLTNPGLELIVYDHHPALGSNLTGEAVITELVGAVTTLLIEMMQQQKIEISPLEATIFALGIYEDTGCLLHASTTVRDVEAVAYLLAHGANLDLVSDFIDRPLNGEQKELFNVLLKSVSIKRINGVDVLLAQTETDDFVQGLGYLVYRLAEIEDADVYLVAVKMEDRVHLVGRSRIDSVSVAEILKDFGGGGHARAASATVKEKTMSLSVIIEQLLKTIEEKVKPALVAAQIMSSPVKTVPPDATLEETFYVLLRNGHTGLPVVENGKLVGVISRRDVDKARHHGLGHAPVKAYMSRQVLTISPETPVSDIQELMVEHDVGRLPIVQDGVLVGIVTRTDILRTWHGENYPHAHRVTYHSRNWHRLNIAARLADKLPPATFTLLKEASEIAATHQIPLFVVGGFVRDFLLDCPSIDIDFVVEGDGLHFAELMADNFNGNVSPHPGFGTATLYLPDGQKIDIATARQEFYEYPAALPQVDYGSVTLRQDLYRRDFTINAMAIDLRPEDFGNLIDFFGSLNDLRQGVIRVLYNLSFIEDPTRILRAIKYEQRYDFVIEDETRGFIQQAREAGVLHELGAERLREELMLLLNELYPWRAVKRLAELDLLDFFFPGVVLDEGICFGLQKIERMREWFATKAVAGASDLRQVIVLVLTYQMSEQALTECGERLHLSQHLLEKIRQLQFNYADCADLLNTLEELAPSMIYRKFSQFSLAVNLALLALMQQPRAQARLLTFLEYTQTRQLALNGDDLKAMGYHPGPAFREAFAALTDARLDGLVHNRGEEVEFIRKFMAEKERGNK